jgi:hypothetical protein
MRYVSLVGLFLILGACTKPNHSKVSHEIWLPWPDQSGSYQIQKVTVNTISDWAPLRGTAVDVRSHVDRIDANTFSFREVMLEYSHDKSGAIIPLTRFATEIASIYAHFEQLQKLDLKLDLPDADRTRRVYVRFLKVDEQEKYISVNNAYYDGSVDSFFIVPYYLKGLPISVNGAILAHEHFHSIFNRLVKSKINIARKAKESEESKAPGPTSELPTVETSTQPTVPINTIPAKSGPVISGPTNSGKPTPVAIGDSPHASEFARSVFNVFNFAVPPPSLFDKIENAEIDPLVQEANRPQFLNEAMEKGLNEGLADVWAWLYSNDPCFMAHSFGGARPKTGVISDEHSSLCPNDAPAAFDITAERCLKPDLKNLKMFDLDLMSKKYFQNFKCRRREDSTDFAYKLGTNLARLIYLRLDERGELQSQEARFGWAKRIVEVIPSFLPHLLKVLVDENKKKSFVQWENIIDVLLFGPGSASITPENCARWANILSSSQKMENFKSKCQ